MMRALLVCLCATVAAQQAPPVFRSGADAVSIIAAVFDGDRVVTGLRVSDFELRDNGRLQKLETADFNVLPIDLRLVFDTSGSISEEDLAWYLRTMRRVTATLQPKDRCEIITFSERISAAAARQSPPVAIDLKRSGPDGTAFFDAVSLALVTMPTTDRRQITIVMSDGRDNASFFDESTLLDAADHTDAVVYTVLPGDPKDGRQVSVSRLQALALLTSGRLIRTHESAVASAIIDAIEEFRQSYMLRYQPTGVGIDGWHKVEVRIPGGRYRVRAAPGYFGR